MNINFLCNLVDGGWEPTDKFLRGTENSIVEWAEKLTWRGNTVQVFRNPREWFDSTIHKGVIYSPRELYKGGGHVCINVKSSDVAPQEPTLYLTNETDADKKDLSMYDGIIWPSEWAKDNIPVNNPNIYIVPHAFGPRKNLRVKKTRNKCIYTSSPDRGLETLERIWPSVAGVVSDAQLVVTYGGQIAGPNIICGTFDNEQMQELYETAEFWLHPANGGELYCISAVKAQAAQAIPVYFPVMALNETVKHGVPCFDERDMYGKLIELMNNGKEKVLYRKRMAATKYPNIRYSTDKLEEAITAVV